MSHDQAPLSYPAGILLLLRAKHCWLVSSLSTGMDKEIKKESHTFQNTPGLRRNFIEWCLQEVSKEGYQGSSLKSKSWQNLIQLIRDNYKISLDQKTLKNHWDYLKKDYDAWRKLKMKTGHGFDGSYFDWPEEVWRDFIQKYPRAKKFKKKPLDDADLLEQLFDNILAKGDDVMFSADPLIPDDTPISESQHTPISETQHTPSSETQQTETIQTLSDDYFSGHNIPTDNNQSSDVFATPKISRKRTKEDKSSEDESKKRNTRNPSGDEDIKKLVSIIEEQAQREKEEKEAEKAHSLEECIASITKMKEVVPITSNVYLRAIKALSEHPSHRKAFMLLLNVEDKLDFLHIISGVPL